MMWDACTRWLSVPRAIWLPLSSPWTGSIVWRFSATENAHATRGSCRPAKSELQQLPRIPEWISCLLSFFFFFFFSPLFTVSFFFCFQPFLLFFSFFLLLCLFSPFIHWAIHLLIDLFIHSFIHWFFHYLCCSFLIGSAQLIVQYLKSSIQWPWQFLCIFFLLFFHPFSHFFFVCVCCSTLPTSFCILFVSDCMLVLVLLIHFMVCSFTSSLFIFSVSLYTYWFVIYL